MFSRSLWEWWDQLPWGFWGLWRHLQQRRGAGDGAGGGSSKKRAWKQRGEAETSDRALDWGWEVIHNPLEDSKEPLFQSWQSLCLDFLWESFPNYPRSWGRGLIPENSSGAKEKKIPQLAARGPWTLHKNLPSCREFGKIFFFPSKYMIFAYWDKSLKVETRADHFEGMLPTCIYWPCLSRGFFDRHWGGVLINISRKVRGRMILQMLRGQKVLRHHRIG